MSFSLIEVFIYIGLAQGIFILFSINKIKNRNREALRYLSFFMAITIIMLGTRLKYTVDASAYALRLGHIFDTLIWLYGMMLYAFIRQSLYKKIFKLNRIHFISVISFVGIAIVLNILSLETYYKLIEDGWLMPYFSFNEALCILLNSYYLIRSLNMIKAYQKEQNSFLSYDQNTIQFYNIYVWSVICYIVLWAIAFITFHYIDPTATYLYQVSWVLMYINLYVISYYSLVNEKTFRIQEEKLSKERLLPEKISLIKESTHDLMINKNIHLDPDLTLSVFAKNIDTSTNDLSWYLNNVEKESFYDFINKFRIQSFIWKLENGEHSKKSILTLSMETGFKSNTTFYKAFKKVTDLTPSQYIKQKFN